MKTTVLKIVFVSLLLWCNYYKVTAQTCIRTVEESVEETTEEISSDIGEEGGEMILQESDLIGSEVIGEAAAEAAAEVGAEATAEIATEVLVGSALLDAIPVAGEVIAVAEAVAFIGLGIYEGIKLIESLFNTPDLYDYREKYKARLNALNSGEFRMPVYPSYHSYAEDLDGEKGKFSALFYLNKTYDSSSAKNYLLQSSTLGKHIGKTYPLNSNPDADSPYNHMSYGFSKLTTTTSESISNLGALPHLPILIKRHFPKITIYKNSQTNQYHYTFEANWSHQANTETINPKHKQFTLEIDFYTATSKKIDFPLQFWLAKKYKNSNRTENIIPIPPNKIHIEEIQDQLAIRIKEIDISEYQDSNASLYITIPLRHPKNHIMVNGKSAFPEDWNPYENLKNDANGRFYRGQQIDNTTGRHFARSYRPFNKNADANLYPNTKGLEPPLTTTQLFYFRIHDYQPADTEISIQDKDLYQINYSPKITLTNRTKYSNTDWHLPSPKKHKSNLLLNIPFQQGARKIQNIDIHALHKPLGINITLTTLPKPNNLNYSLLTAKLSFINDQDEFEMKSIIGDLFSIHKIEGEEVPKASYPHQKIPSGSTLNHLKWLLQNTPFTPGDLIMVSTFYEDGSVIKNLLRIPLTSNSILDRKYYNLSYNTDQFIKQKKTTLKLSNANIEDPQSQWLLELNHKHGYYAIMNRDSKMVLGVVNNKLGLYKWSFGEATLLWKPSFSEDNLMSLYNLGSETYLTIQDNELNHNSSTKTFFNLQERKESVPPLLIFEDGWLTSKKDNLVFDGRTDQEVTLAAKNSSDNNHQQTSITYTGCLTYAIIRAKDSTHIKYDPLQNKQIWAKEGASLWYLNYLKNDTISQEYFSLSNQEKQYLYNTGNFQLRTESNYKESDNKYQFSFRTKTDDVIRDLDSNLILEYPLNKDANDISGNEYHGTLHGDSQGFSFINDLQRGKVASFNGVDQYIDTNLNVHPSNYQGSITVACWMKTSDGGDTDARIIETETWSMTRTNTDTALRFNADPNNTDGHSHRVYEINSISDNQWHHIAMVMRPSSSKNGTVKTLYIDGVKVASDTAVIALRNGGATTLIGKGSQDFNALYKGYMDDVKIWNTALNEHEVTKEYEQTKGPSLKDLLCGENTTLTTLPQLESFETTLGIWSQNSDDHINWSRHSKATSSFKTGPSGASDGDYYLYIEASRSNQPEKTAIITSKCLQPNATDGIQFEYHMFGSKMGSLHLEIKTETNDWTTLWSKSGNQGNNWNTETISLADYAGQVVKLRFKGITGRSWSSDIALDNIQIKDSFCESEPLVSPQRESFETTLGIWSTENYDYFNWSRHSNGTTSNGTGPSGANDGKYYLYMEASASLPNPPEKIAFLTSKCLHPNLTDTIQFDYHMYGSHMGSLELEIKTPTNDWTALWSKSGNQGNNWTTETVSLADYAGQIVKLRFKGVIGSSWSSDIAIDNIKIKSDNQAKSYATKTGKREELSSGRPLSTTKEDIVVYPNPFNEGFTVQFTDAHIGEKVSVLLYDANWKTFYTEELIVATKTIKIKPITALSKGTYYLKLQYRDQLMIKKLLKK